MSNIVMVHADDDEVEVVTEGTDHEETDHEENTEETE